MIQISDEQRVQNGIDWLDATFGIGDWADEIDLSILNLEDSQCCVLGQIVIGQHWADDYFDAMEQFGFDDIAAQERAFDVAIPVDRAHGWLEMAKAETANLTTIWRRRIAEIQEGVPA